MATYDECLAEAAEAAGCSVEDWVEVQGPETGVGVERWFVNKKDESSGVYVVDDQGHCTWSLHEMEV